MALIIICRQLSNGSMQICIDANAYLRYVIYNNITGTKMKRREKMKMNREIKEFFECETRKVIEGDFTIHYKNPPYYSSVVAVEDADGNIELIDTSKYYWADFNDFYDIVFKEYHSKRNKEYHPERNIRRIS